MAGDNYYLMTALPALGELGSPPPLSAAELLAHVRPNGGAADLVEAVLLSDDLIQREAFLAGEVEQVSPAVLTVAQAKNDQPLPDFLVSDLDESHVGIAVDRLWAAYYHHAASIASRCSSRFLTEWLGYEVSLRNALAVARAKALDIDPVGYTVAAELGGEYDFSVLLAEWAAASNPLAGLRVLDKARWRWLTENDAWFTFADDELVAYAVKLMLLCRWRRLTEPQNTKSNRPEKAQKYT
ncbi:MAG: DUF2764 family protein [Planctomycetota bacterium]|nr:DUF2764 family protein [Planctomycetota bacterium]